MIKKVIDFNRLPKQEYQKPVMKVIELQHKSQILAGSVTSASRVDGSQHCNAFY